MSRPSSEISWKRLFWYILAGSRGGPNRGRIMNLLRREPYNINKLAEAPQVHYRAAEHHIQALEKYQLVPSDDEKHRKLYLLSIEMQAQRHVIHVIWGLVSRSADR